MSKTKEFLENFKLKWGKDALDMLVQRMEAEEKEWYLESERPYVADDNEDDSSITEQGI